MSPAAFRTAARVEGFALCGFAQAGTPPHAAALRKWLDDGFQADMEWMRRTVEERCDPTRLLPGVATIIVLAKNYFFEERPAPVGDAPRGVIARYARGADYHEVLRPRLDSLAALLARAGGQQRVFIDGGPVLERDWAAISGVSWHGKSTMGIHPKLGTWFLLSVILTTLEFPPDRPQSDHCGRCTRCLDACPTRAIVAPYRLDARRCLSYLTIENKGAIPEEFRRALGARIFGCDDCLDACPWNRFAQASRDTALQPREDLLARPLREFLSLDDRQFKDLFRGSPILRAKRRGFLRNVCVALGNVGTAADLPALERARLDPEPLIAGHATWAIEEIKRRAPDPHQPLCSTESR
jgi:epoxyqueuosine reductase